MGGRNFLCLILVSGIVLFGLAACSAGEQPSTPAPIPTLMVLPSPTVKPSETPLPTSSPEPAATPTDDVQPVHLVLEDTLYKHPNGMFELYPPAGWRMTENDSSVSFLDPQEVGFISIQVTNTGYELDSKSFENFINARDVNFFGTYSGYEETDRQVNPAEHIASVAKRLIFQGTSQTVVSFYDQKGQTIYVIDFWADESQFDLYNVMYDEFFNNITVDSSVASSLTPYVWVYTFTGPGGLFTIDVPTSWTYEYREGVDALIDTFTAPDSHALIQNLTYDNGQVVTRTEAGKLALDLLRTYYASDITITDDKIQPDGSERLTWYSPGGDYRGVSFLETRGTAFLLFTIMYDNPYEDIYLDVLEYTVNSYKVL
jgi:hypothetical protein